MNNYLEFLKKKIDIAPQTGIDISPDEVNPILKPHQRDSVVWAVRGGRRGLFQACGLGKTVEQLEFCRIILKHKGGKALIVVYLGVRQEFTHDAVELLGMEKPEYVTNMDEVRNCKTDIMLTNYERVRDGDIDPTYFTVTALDEASCLRSYGSKTYQTFLDKFKGVPYKLVSTATPSPNRFKELIHYAGYLEVMDTGQALTRFFKRDSTKANNLTLYPEREDEFWLWVSSWGLFLDKPSDLGYSDEGYILPEMEIRWHKIHADTDIQADRDGQITMTFMVAAPGSWSPEVWDDINRMRTLNTDQSRRRKTMHVCPLQIDIVERIIGRYSNKGDVVYDPFAGLFTVPYVAVKNGRYGIGVELSEDYFTDGLSYLEIADRQDEAVTLFDLLDESEETA